VNLKLTPRDLGTHGDAGRRSLVVLWIHDLAQSAPGSIQELDRESMDVEVVDSYRAALVRLGTTLYDAIVIHTNTACGGIVERIRQSGCQAPLVVLASRAAANSALEAVNQGVSIYIDGSIEGLEIEHEVLTHLRACTPGARIATARNGAATLPCRLSSDARAERDLFEQANVLANILSERGLSSALAPRDFPLHLWSPEGVALTNGLMNAMSTPHGSIRLAYASSATFKSLISPQRATAARLIQIARTLFGRRLQAIKEPTRLPMAQVLLHLENDLRRGVRPSARSVAAVLAIDATYLGRRLHRESGLTFCQWRGLFSMSLAARLLVETLMIASQIAYRLGFQHPSHFARECRGAMGISAVQYRRLAVALRSELGFSRTELGEDVDAVSWQQPR